VYNDVAKDEYYRSKGKEYSDLADTTLLLHEPELFWKFWGDCVESYRNTDCHNGYHILNNWCSTLPKLACSTSTLPSSTHVYTSNVDGHFRRFDKLRSGLTEIHGCAEESVCSSSIGHFVMRRLIAPDGSHSDTPDNDIYEVTIRERAGNTFAEWNDRVPETRRLQCIQHLVTTPSTHSPHADPSHCAHTW
jgi:NAD-dependent SIR2 family protein deacetylase